jgi:hypothetical protein
MVSYPEEKPVVRLPPENTKLKALKNTSSMQKLDTAMTGNKNPSSHDDSVVPMSKGGFALLRHG